MNCCSGLSKTPDTIDLFLDGERRYFFSNWRTRAL